MKTAVSVTDPMFRSAEQLAEMQSSTLKRYAGR
jgi:hypothetical protein